MQSVKLHLPKNLQLNELKKAASLSERRIGILQPVYLPWLGYFEQIHRSDVFVFYDDVQYDKNGWRNRNRIKTTQGWQWLTVPVLTKGSAQQKVCEVRIDNKVNWRIKHLNAIRQSYARAPFLKKYIGIFEEIYAREWEHLLDIDMAFLYKLMEVLELEAEVHLSSQLNIHGGQTERLVSIVKHFGGTYFYEGASGKNYIDEGLFTENNIKLVYQDYQHPVYAQLHGEFVSHMSIIDLLFNCGEQAREIFVSNQKD
jgi:hypothetical protein